VTLAEAELAGRPASGAPILRVDGLTVAYQTPRGVALAVDDASLTIQPGEIVGLVGESGSGKSTLAHAVMRLIAPPGYIAAGDIDFAETDLMKLDTEQLRRFRWERASIVTQSAMNALNPVTTIRTQMRDTFRAHRKLSRGAADERAVELLKLVGLPSDRLDSYPHELSGGMRQRVVIALALALEPELVIMDEPTTALDVVLQREIIDEIRRLRARFGFSLLFITHDVSLLAEFCDRIAVMYAGKIVEDGPAQEVVERPRHPYTRLLLESVPSVTGPRRRLHGIQGTPPDLVQPPSGCRFHPRCPKAFLDCSLIEPALYDGSGVAVACLLYAR
jgi:peptide/nickel transport system ATP-binding protein